MHSSYWRNVKLVWIFVQLQFQLSKKSGGFCGWLHRFRTLDVKQPYLDSVVTVNWLVS
jgi:hypothetical protein